MSLVKKKMIYLLIFVSIISCKSSKKINKEEEKQKLYYHPEISINKEQKKIFDMKVLNSIKETEEIKMKQLQEMTKLQKQIKIRKLEEEFITWEHLGFFDLDQKWDESKRLLALKSIFGNTTKTSSRFLLYPYKFSYKNETNDEVNITTGGILSLDEANIKDEVLLYKTLNISTINLKKTKAIYGSDIAILSIPYVIDKIDSDLFYEGTTYCTFFISAGLATSSCPKFYDELQAFRQKKPNIGTAFYCNHTDILKGILYDEVTSKINLNLLIIPDYGLDLESVIDSYINKDVIAKIKKFRDLGGHILATGKSGYLLERWGIITANSYDTSKTLNTLNTANAFYVKGCENIFEKEFPTNEIDFCKQTICYEFSNYQGFINSFIMKSIPDKFEKIIDIRNNELYMATKKDGYLTPLTDKTLLYPYLVISDGTEKNKGRIFIINGSPITKTNYIQVLRNIILYSLSKNIIFDIKIKFGEKENERVDLPIPAGEENIQLNTYYKLQNLFTETISKIEIIILFVPKIKIIIPNTIPNCNLYTDSAYNTYESKGFQTNYYFKCTPPDLGKLSKFDFSYKMELQDQSITQQQKDIKLIYTILKYKDDETGENIILEDFSFKAQAGLAARIRGTILGNEITYPLYGTGEKASIDLAIENKENTEAKNVKFISIIPLIGPLKHGLSETFIKNLPIYDYYYRNHEYTFPWKDTVNRESDYLDFSETKNLNLFYGQDEETPVIQYKHSRESLIKDNTIKNIYPDFSTEKYIMLGQSKEDPDILKRQLYFPDVEKFYEKPQRRNYLFIDPNSKESCEAMYRNDIPKELQDPHDSSKVKYDFIFVRYDLFFKASGVQVPEGFDNKMYISVDNYNQSKVTKTDSEFLSKKSEIYKQGHFNSTQNKYETLISEEYTNPHKLYNNIEYYNPLKQDEFEKLQNRTQEKIKLTHYIIPLSSSFSDLIYADQIKGFQLDSKDSKSGFMIDYPSVKFIYAHTIFVDIDPLMTKIGGIIEIELPNDVNFEEEPIANDYITFSADNLAIYNTTYDVDSKKIKLYFKRGLLPNENAGKINKCKVYLEKLNKQENITNIKLSIYQIKYDFTSETLETIEIVINPKNYVAIYTPLWSFPALYLENTLKRKRDDSDEYKSSLKEYEIYDPFVKYGLYMQELNNHANVYGIYSYHVSKPGKQADSMGYNVLFLIGTAYVPFREYMTGPSSNLIAGAISTTRLEWEDIWGRKWVQNLRSLDECIAPGGVDKDFSISTTFEILAEKNEERLLEWPSDENVYIHVIMKFNNPYSKYFDPLICKENQVNYILDKPLGNRDPEYFEPYPEQSMNLIKDGKESEHLIHLGYNSTYGQCYADEKAFLSGQEITADIKDEITNMMLCKNSENITEINECSKKASENKFPTFTKREENKQDNSLNKTWNFSPKVLEYYPEGYINEASMWDLTHIDYENTLYYKGMVFHMDNTLPGPMVAEQDNPTWYKPNNLLAFPIFKGVGYKITYEPNYQIKKYKEYQGWWSDQLQDRDHTLIAGQQKVNKIAVGQKSLLDESFWINARDVIEDDVNRGNMTARLSNVYVCKFNQYKIKVDPKNKKYAWPYNVFKNYVIPVDPEIDDNDPKLKNFNCDNYYMYTPKNISLSENRIYTSNDRDWLYFAINLRAEAKENLHVLLKMQPAHLFEGLTKIQDGARFTYWRATVPPAFNYADAPVSVINSKRVDLQIEQYAMPLQLSKIRSDIYYIFRIFDEEEIGKEYTSEIYTNTYGFGDSAAKIYVGGVKDTSVKVYPGSYTIATITLFNNAGFDWNIKSNGIEFGNKKYDGTELLKNIQPNIKNPNKYNIFTFEVPDEIKKYITIKPSLDFIDINPIFLLYSCKNIATIKDGWQGEYSIRIDVSNNFDAQYEGKLWEIKVKINKEYFDSLPNYNDPTGIHKDINFEIPSIKFGVPIRKGKEYEGKIFYYNGQASNIRLKYLSRENFVMNDLKIISKENFLNLESKSFDNENKYNLMRDYWNTIPSISDWKLKTNYSYSFTGYFYLHYFNLSGLFNYLPYEVKTKPACTEHYIAVKSRILSISWDQASVISDSQIIYRDGRKEKSMKVPDYISGQFLGPYIQVTITNELLKLENNTLKVAANTKDKILYIGDTKIIRAKLNFKNSGNGIAYRSNFELNIINNAELYEDTGKIDSLMTYSKNNNNDGTYTLKINYGNNLVNGDSLSFDIIFKVKIAAETLRNLDSNSNTETSALKIIKSTKTLLCKTSKECKPEDENDLNGADQISIPSTSITIKNKARIVGYVDLTIEQKGTDTNPIYVLNATGITTDEECLDLDSSCHISKVKYLFYRKIEGIDKDFVLIASQSSNIYEDTPFEIENNKNYQISYKVEGLYEEDQRTLIYKLDELDGEYSKNIKKNKKFKAWIYVLIVIFVIIIVAGIVFIIYKIKKKEKFEKLRTHSKVDKADEQRAEGKNNSVKQIKIQNDDENSNQDIIYKRNI